MKRELTDRLEQARRLAIAINPRPSITHPLKVLDYLRLADDSVPEGIAPSDWKSLLDRWSIDDSVGLTRGAVYLVGDVVEVDRFEAAELLSILPAYFEPADRLTQSLAEAIQRGEA